MFAKHDDFVVFLVERIGKHGDRFPRLTQGGRLAIPITSPKESVCIEVDLGIRVMIHRVVRARREGPGNRLGVQEMFELVEAAVDGLAALLLGEDVCLATILRGRRTRVHQLCRCAIDRRRMWNGMGRVVVG